MGAVCSSLLHFQFQTTYNACYCIEYKCCDYAREKAQDTIEYGQYYDGSGPEQHPCSLTYIMGPNAREKRVMIAPNMRPSIA